MLVIETAKTLHKAKSIKGVSQNIYPQWQPPQSDFDLENTDIVSSTVGNPLFMREPPPPPFWVHPLSKANLKNHPLFLRAIQIGACKL